MCLHPLLLIHTTSSACTQVVIRTLNRVRSRITDEERALSIQLSSSRLTLHRTLMFFSLALLFINTSALVANIFGMNLESNVKEANWWFKGVVICAAGFVAVASVVAYFVLPWMLKE